jgi:CBS domain-containing protein
MTGGAFGSMIAQFFRLTSSERKTLLVAGAAAGMAATFGAPIASVLLAVELLLFEWKPRSLIPVALAAAAATTARRYLLDPAPLFPAGPFPGFVGFDGLMGCVVAGLLAGVLSLLLTKGVYASEDAFAKLPVHWMWWPAIGGIAIGIGGLIFPQALGVGYDVIAGLVSGHMMVQAVVAILLVKGVIWLVALASGTSGGVLAPLLILGGTLGYLVGLVLPGDPALWALLGMGGMMGGTMRAPLTSTLFIIELTGNVHLLIPLFTATVAAYAFTVLALRRSILTEKIARRGRHITREYGTDPFELTRAFEIMVKTVDTLPAEMPINEATAFFGQPEHAHRSYPVVLPGGAPVGMVSRADALRWRAEGDHADQTLYDLVSDASVTVAHPDDLVGRVTDLMIAADLGRIPVVDPATHVLVGLIARKDILRLRSANLTEESERQAFLGRSMRNMSKAIRKRKPPATP